MQDLSNQIVLCHSQSCHHGILTLLWEQLIWVSIAFFIQVWVNLLQEQNGYCNNLFSPLRSCLNNWFISALKITWILHTNKKKIYRIKHLKILNEVKLYLDHQVYLIRAGYKLGRSRRNNSWTKTATRR